MCDYQAFVSVSGQHSGRYVRLSVRWEACPPAETPKERAKSNVSGEEDLCEAVFGSVA